MPSLFLQKLIWKFKIKHLKLIQRCYDLWDRGNIEQFISVARTVRNYLNYINRSKWIAYLSKDVFTMIGKVNVNGALNLCTNNISNGVSLLDVNIMRLLHKKYPTRKIPDDEVLMTWKHNVYIQKYLKVLTKSAQNMQYFKQKKLRALPDPDRWRKMLAFHNYGTRNTNLQKALSKVIKKVRYSKVWNKCQNWRNIPGQLFSITVRQNPSSSTLQKKLGITAVTVAM